MYVAECLTTIWLERNRSTMSTRSGRPTTTGMLVWNSCGGDPVLCTTTVRLPPPDMTKSRPRARPVDRARHHCALQPERRGAERGLVGQGLVHGVEVVERAAEPFDQQEDDGADQDGEDHDQPQPVARRAPSWTANRAPAVRWRAVGGAAVVTVTAAPAVDPGTSSGAAVALATSAVAVPSATCSGHAPLATAVGRLVTLGHGRRPGAVGGGAGRG